MLHSQRLFGPPSVSFAPLSVRQDDGSRGCFVDTERTLFLECSRPNVWISGLRYGAGGWLWAGWRHHTVPLNFSQPLKFLFLSRKLKYCAVLACWWSSITGLQGDGGKRRPSVDQRWAAGPGFKGKEERPGRGKMIMLFARVNSRTGFHHLSCRSPPGSTSHQTRATSLFHTSTISICTIFYSPKFYEYV